MPSNNNLYPYRVEDINLIVTSILDSEIKEEKKLRSELEAAEVITAPTNHLVDIMIGFGTIGKDNLTAKENDLRKMISEELKNRAKADRM